MPRNDGDPDDEGPVKRKSKAEQSEQTCSEESITPNGYGQANWLRHSRENDSKISPAADTNANAEVTTPSLRPDSKQSKVLALLRRIDGTTIETIMQATGWQQHSVRGFLAGVVRKKLKLDLDSQLIDGARRYRIKSAATAGGVGKSARAA